MDPKTPAINIERVKEAVGLMKRFISEIEKIIANLGSEPGFCCGCLTGSGENQ